LPMATPAVLTLLPAQETDRSSLANLLHFERHVHRHLDWRRPLDWLGHEPFLVAEDGGRLVATLACPPDPPGVSWLRLFAATSHVNIAEAWDLLWPKGREKLAGVADDVIAIPLHTWLADLLGQTGFAHENNVVVLDWRPAYGWQRESDEAVRGTVRPMIAEDIKFVEQVDRAGFPKIWRHSMETMQLAFAQSKVATVIEMDGRVAAYQISTQAAQGLHLARLAVHPDWQGMHLALALVEDLQARLENNTEQRLTVNTQDTNKPSLGLYNKTGFKRTGEAFPVYRLSFM
jgi:ribosomal protein S18 acetylase RimI-like enzyme